MSAKTTGAEFKRFYSDAKFWPDGSWHDDDVIIVDGVHQEYIEADKIPDSSNVVIKCGFVFLSQEDDTGVALDTYFKRWLKAQTTRTVLVEIDAAKLDDLFAAINSCGGKVVSGRN